MLMDATELKAVPIFAQLQDSEAEQLAGMLSPQTIEANQPLFWIGERGDAFYVIQQGKIRITFPDESGREITLAVLGPGDFLGEIALLDGGTRTATARAAERTVVLALSRDELHSFIRANPAVAIHMMSVLGSRQRDTVERLRGIRNVNEVATERSSRWQRIAALIAAVAANEFFLLMHAVVFGGWIVMNVTLGRGRAPDPFPFPFLCFWSSCEAIFLSLFILVTQNTQAAKDRIRTEVEYQVALKMQLEIMQLHQKIDRLPEVMAEAESEESR
jgi:uncharacterized membrane protein